MEAVAAAALGKAVTGAERLVKLQQLRRRLLSPLLALGLGSELLVLLLRLRQAPEQMLRQRAGAM